MDPVGLEPTTCRLCGVAFIPCSFGLMNRKHKQQPREDQMQCIVCGTPLTGRQTKFCGRKCQNSHGNKRHQDYACQQERGRTRRQQLIHGAGGRCVRCGYYRNEAALNFHHVDPSTKLFNLDIRSCSNRKWEALVAEAAKCLLLCANCHTEAHNEHLTLE